MLMRQERFPVHGIAEGFGAAAPSRGQSPREIAIFQTLFNLRPSNELMKKTGIEAVARANGIHRRNLWGRRFNDLGSPASNRSLFTALHDYHGNFLRQKF